mmetsp:Transcript_68630/g.153140  ORF Transcript_68630/g.153140 Transcript_68630/m.153140 type:complete len:507 (-) Transcript_68630:883-2403(-)|eukprot:CAMPEP_0181209612 /NCGR_PEP_ID=MMETSP1096-20121128/22765_1 /TAXON_ID=156174 ORGANISM="Chrysochromulina ericina, Strain CCMP281" /NCGR_SAMPLE_ID=MMETSP1096 /ASSEMBLY_ACC=CAM_ASM_000453 /LENGTH=506 /DNA_ID=CAMNT_0023300797 /DNA_START=31 /DNA_END=1551 /DNA_ORIENTATION=-
MTGADVDATLQEMMNQGDYFYKHDFGRNKRSRKWLILSTDGLSLRWRSVGATEVVGAGDGSNSSRGGSSGRGLLRSASFSRYTTIALSDVSHIIYGPYTDTFARKTAHDRNDARWCCFSLVLRESRTVDFAAEDETILLPWLLGLQQLIVYFAPTLTSPAERWTLSKLHLQKLRLKVSGESDKSGQGPYDVVLSAVLDVAQELQTTSSKATVLQAAWRRRNVQGKFQTAVQEIMEINGLIEGIEEKERELKDKQTTTALKIEAAIKQAEKDEPPPKMPSELDMKDPRKMQEYMLQMGEYSARQQLKLANMESEVKDNQLVTAQMNSIAEEKRRLQNMSEKLQFSISSNELESLSPEDAAKVQAIQASLGVTPRGSIKAENVRQVRLYKDHQSTRLGIIFHQNTPSELGDVSVDKTPRANGQQPVVIPVIKVLDKSGIAGNATNLFEGDQVLSVNGKAALSNIQAVQMLREAVGEVVLAVRETPLSKTPRGPASGPITGLRPLNQQK